MGCCPCGIVRKFELLLKIVEIDHFPAHPSNCQVAPPDQAVCYIKPYHFPNFLLNFEDRSQKSLWICRAIVDPDCKYSCICSPLNPRHTVPQRFNSNFAIRIIFIPSVSYCHSRLRGIGIVGPGFRGPAFPNMTKRRANREGNLRKRKDGRWEGRYTAGRDSETGKAIYRNVLVRTQVEARAKLKQALEEAKQVDPVKAKQYTVGGWMGIWFENYAKVQVRPSFHQTYRGYIDNHIKPNIGKIPLDKITSLNLKKFYKKLLCRTGWT